MTAREIDGRVLFGALSGGAVGGALVQLSACFRYLGSMLVFFYFSDLKERTKLTMRAFARFWQCSM